MTSTQKITVPEQAYRELLCGGDPQEIANRCEIGFPFERRDWMATVAGVIVMMEYLSITTDQRGRLCDLSNAINEMIQRDMDEAKKRIDAMKDNTHVFIEHE